MSQDGRAVDFDFVEIRQEHARLLGKVRKGTRLFLRSGTQQEYCDWFDEISREFGTLVSPGGAAARVGVSRASVYKRMKLGRLTAFSFLPKGWDEAPALPGLLGRVFSERKIPYCYVPVCECDAWRKELEARIARIKQAQEDIAVLEAEEGTKKDWDGTFLGEESKD